MAAGCARHVVGTAGGLDAPIADLSDQATTNVRVRAERALGDDLREVVAMSEVHDESVLRLRPFG
jgi:hypothetical protein